MCWPEEPANQEFAALILTMSAPVVLMTIAMAVIVCLGTSLLNRDLNVYADCAALCFPDEAVLQSNACYCRKSDLYQPAESAPNGAANPAP